MEVQFTPEQEQRLAEMAAKAGTGLEELIMCAALTLLDRDKAKSATVAEIPTFNLGEVKSLHRCDIYDDVA